MSDPSQVSLHQGHQRHQAIWITFEILLIAIRTNDNIEPYTPPFLLPFSSPLFLPPFSSTHFPPIFFPFFVGVPGCWGTFIRAS